MSQILIKHGVYRNKTVTNQVFTLVKGYQVGAKGGFVTVEGSDFAGIDKIRIKVDSISDYEFIKGDDMPHPVTAQVAVETETDEQIMTRIGERFEILHEMAKAAIAGDVRAMIVTGPPGVGKSYIVEKEIEMTTMLDKIAGRKIRSEVVKGSTTALGLYCTLYKYSDPGNVLVFDDCDSALLDDVSLNLLKGALDTGKKRKISWLSDSSMLRREDVPDNFEFKGTIIFITNINFDNIRSKNLKDHLAALTSRCHYIDLTINTTREKVLRIKQVAQEAELFEEYDFTPKDSEEIVDFIAENHANLREISIRTAIKIADLKRTFPTNWQKMARTTCMRPS